MKMKLWKIGAIIGAVWGLLGVLSGGVWLNPMIRYTFALPTTLAYPIAGLSYFIFGSPAFSHIVLFLLAIGIGALIGAGIGYVFEVGLKLRRRTILP